MSQKLGSLLPKQSAVIFATGDVGCYCCSIKTVADTRVGDGDPLATNPASEPLHGYKQMNPMVFCRSLPNRIYKYNDLREALKIAIE